ncbi:riboflavin synthase [Flavobacterium sp. NKUCC04_CG]|uniref:riboflavin synthase n=1 Tax=Flavobacterium sp. NKUCC04_CG TaxID=2842121 RepID=UPI001C5BF1CC|nr:riboflavin synthase [Flavobacterium sp. NKUCC04_CG]MBW3520275.1 riboflavin synthase [Flavobacterium sp. NKUCC04_CG]
MFTGIVESIGRIENIEKEGENLHITIGSPLAIELKIDQSVSHNGICLTVVAVTDSTYTVTGIKETIGKTSMGQWKLGDRVNLERAMILGTRLDGHLVQGHVDQTARCISMEDSEGSIYFGFEYDEKQSNITIEKGSITVDGTSLTVVDSGINTFKVAIIPYTLEHTLFGTYKIGTVVNLEFDVIGKYVAKMLSMR